MSELRGLVLRNVQALRAIAALAVVIGHCGWMISDPGSTTSRITDGIAHAGVDVFFVISGFVMATVIARLPEISRWQEGARFALRRAVRIYPPFWLVAVVTILFSSILPTMNGPSPYSRLAEFLLVAPDNGILFVAWTLCFELLFYAVCSIAIAILDARALWLVIPVMLILAATALTPIPVLGSLRTPLLAEFTFGIVVAVAAARPPNRALPGAWLLPIGLTWLGIGSYVNAGIDGGWNGLVRLVAMGLPAALVLYSLVTIELLGRLRAPRPLTFLGDASYSIYLWHIFVLVVLSRIGLATSQSPLSMIVSFLLATLFGAAIYWIVERPMLRMSYAIVSWLTPPSGVPRGSTH